MLHGEDDGWERWRGEVTTDLRDVKADIGEIKSDLRSHASSEMKLLIAALVLMAGGILSFILSKI